MNRIVNPCGILINIPELTSNQLANFKNKIEKKLGLLFRFVICNSENLPMLDFKGLVGSTLVIRIQKNFNPKKAIKTHWLDPRYKGVIINDTFDTDYLVDIYYEKILDAIKKRNRFKGQSGNEL